MLPLNSRLLYVALCCLLYQIVAAQNTIGIPNIINYSKNDYHAGNQNWDIKQDKNGILYFANNDGLLSFDGTFWRVYPLPNKTVVRSLAIGDDGRIYTGGQEEIGYFTPNQNGNLVYTSLKNLIPKKDNDFADVWHIVLFQNHVFFQSNKQILDYYHDKISIYKSINWGFAGITGNTVYAQEFKQGLVVFKDGNWLRCSKDSLPQNCQVTSVVAIGKDSTLITTLTHGLFILNNGKYLAFKTPETQHIITKNIYTTYALDSNTIAYATNLAGCFILNNRGEFIQKFTKLEGLQNNNILKIFLDKNKNIWLGLDNGIDLITYNNSIKNIFPEPDDRNAGYAAHLFNNQLYLGGATGLYVTALEQKKDISFSKSAFKYVANSNGKVWNLDEVNGKLLMAHTKGAFVIENDIAKSFDNRTGFWTFQPLYNLNPSPLIVSGTFNGLNFYSYNNGRFSTTKIQAQFESARYIVMQDSTLWIAHPYKGLYKVIFTDIHKPTSSFYKDKNHILSQNHNHLYKIKGRMVLTSDNGIFEYDTIKKDFVPSAYLKQYFGDIIPAYLKEDLYGNIWFSYNKKLGVIDLSGKKPTTIFLPELNNKILAGGYENVYMIDSFNVIIAAQKGFFHLNYHAYKKNTTQIDVLVRLVKFLSPKDSILYGGYSTSSSAITANAPIKYKDNSLHFEYASTLYGQSTNIEYSYYLKGFDKGWAEWSLKSEKDYTNLPEGNYTFQVKCRNNANNESAIADYSFTVSPPWFRTVWAYLLYLLLISFVVFWFYKRQQEKYKKQQLARLKEQQHKHAEEQKHQEYLHQLEIEKNEKEIINLRNAKLQAELEQKNLEEEQKRLQLEHQIAVEQNEKEIINLRNEKLQTEIEHKNSQLASTAMSLVQRFEFLSKIKDGLMVLKEGTEGSKEFKKIIRVIDKELDGNHEWEEFAEHFDNVHTNFLKNLKDRFPELTSHELKLCAYLRLSLSSKEMAQLLNISIRGVETGRYRLRKKLELPNDVHLYDFLLTVT